jgi:hypothetical protein
VGNKPSRSPVRRIAAPPYLVSKPMGFSCWFCPWEIGDRALPHRFVSRKRLRLRPQCRLVPIRFIFFQYRLGDLLSQAGLARRRPQNQRGIQGHGPARARGYVSRRTGETGSTPPPPAHGSAPSAGISLPSGAACPAAQCAENSRLPPLLCFLPQRRQGQHRYREVWCHPMKRAEVTGQPIGKSACRESGKDVCQYRRVRTRLP